MAHVDAGPCAAEDKVLQSWRTVLAFYKEALAEQRPLFPELAASDFSL